MGSSRHGFLPFKELSAEYFDPSKTGEDRFKISEGDDIVVQIQKEERVNKGAALSTYISLASRYIVLMTNHPNGGGISRRIHGEERDKIKSHIEALNVPENMSLIIRTEGIDKKIEELIHFYLSLNYFFQYFINYFFCHLSTDLLDIYENQFS